MDNWYPVISIFAIILGPILAVQVQKYLEKSSLDKERKLSIFKSLMATRGSYLSPEHVRALNMIDLEFKGQQSVINAWREYLDHLSENVSDATRVVWQNKKDDLLVNLLENMSTFLNYGFDKVTLKKGVYSPQGQADLELESFIIRKQLVKLLTGEFPLQISLVPLGDEGRAKAEAFQENVSNVLSGSQPIAVIITKSEEN